MVGRRRNGHDLLTELRVTQLDMRTTLERVETKIDKMSSDVYCVDPQSPGVIVRLDTHLRDHRQAKARERYIVTGIAAGLSTLAIVIDRMLAWFGVK